MNLKTALGRREAFRAELVVAFNGLDAAGLNDEVPALTVVGKKLEQYNSKGLPWRNVGEFKDDVTGAFQESRGSFRLPDDFYSDTHVFITAIDKNKPKFLYKLRDFNWAKIDDEFNKKELVRQTDSLIRDLAKAIGNDNNRVTDTMLLAAIAGKLHVGGDANSNIWKEAAKLHNMGSFVKFFKDLLDHSGRVHNASYTDLPDLVKAFRWELDQHPTLHGDKAKFGTGSLTWE